MIEIMNDLPDNVLGVRASGEVTHDDYANTLVPSLEDKLTRFKKVRLLYQLGDEFTGFSGGAAWEDAKIGMKHLTAFERVGIVTDIDWIENAAKAFGFAFPGEVKVFDGDDFEDARHWVCEPPDQGDLSFKLMKDERVLVLEPKGELIAADFERLAKEIDPFLEEVGGLNGLLVVADKFPGWDDFAAFSSHMKFVREHQARIKRVGMVTSDRVLSAVPRFSSHFLDAEVKTFPTSGRDEALVWVAQG